MDGARSARLLKDSDQLKLSPVDRQEVLETFSRGVTELERLLGIGESGWPRPPVKEGGFAVSFAG